MADKRTRTTMGNRLDWLKKWALGRRYNLGKCRKDFLFIYYCTLKSIYDDLQWPIRILWRMNQKLSVPLDNGDFRKLIHKYADQKKAYKYTNERIITILGITDEEVASLEIGKNKKLVNQRMWNQIFQNEKEAAAIKMHKAGSSTNEIAEATGLGLRKVQRLLKAHREDYHQQRLKKMEEMAVKGISFAAIGREFGCSGDTVRRQLNAAKTTNLTITEIKRASVVLPKISDPSVRRVFSLYKEECVHSSLCEDQVALVALQESRKNIALLGAAGTGKSTIVRRFLDSLPPEERATTLVVAPTGKAASHLGAITIHKAFSLDRDVQPNDDVTSVPENLLNIGRLIIDEANMLRIDIFNKVMKMIQFIEKSEKRHIQVILLADFGQLQPVATKEDVDKLNQYYPQAKGWYIFQSELWEQMHFEENKIILMHIHRQSDPEFREILERVKYGDKSVVHDVNRLADHKEKPEAIYLCPTNEKVDFYNQKASSGFCVAIQKEYVAAATGNIPLAELSCPTVLSLAVGMRIMTVCNTEHYNNGSFGTVTKLLKRSIKVQLDNGEIVTVARKTFKFPNGSTFTQIPVVLAYAITINKAEGCQFDEINLVPGCFAAGQLYTALSRCTTLQGVHLLGNLKERELIVDRAALEMTVNSK